MDETLNTAPETPVAPAVTPAPAPAPAPPAAPAAPAEPETRRDIIAREFKNPTQRGRHAQFQPRQEQGKFAPGTPAIPPEAPQRPAMPKSLRQELQGHWETTPAELQEAIIKREQDYEKGVEPLKTKAQQADELLNEFKPYEWLLRNENATPRAAIGPLLQTAALLRTGTPVQKANAVAQMIRQFGIPLDHVQQLLSGNAPTQPVLDPHVSQLTQQVQQLTQLQQQQREAVAMAAIKEFAADPAHKHFDAVSERMSMLLQTPQVMGANVEQMNEREKLKLAYDTACRLDPAVSQLLATEQQSATNGTAQVAKAKNAAVQVKGAPASGPAPKVNPNDRREVIRNAFRSLG